MPEGTGMCLKEWTWIGVPD